MTPQQHARRMRLVIARGRRALERSTASAKDRAAIAGFFDYCEQHAALLEVPKPRRRKPA
jgi:hypothetical protein